MVILQKNKKKLCKGIFDAFLANQIRLTYGDFEKYLKIYEFAMKNGNFIIFLANFGKSVFYYSEQGKMHGYGWKGRFFKNMLFFPQSILTFCVSCFYAGGKMLIFFGCHLFWFCNGIFQKTTTKNLVHSKVKVQ